jgi:hypothetical protein
LGDIRRIAGGSLGDGGFEDVGRGDIPWLEFDRWIGGLEFVDELLGALAAEPGRAPVVAIEADGDRLAGSGGNRRAGR